MHQGDLVLTDDGYYGIVLGTTVLLGNGLEIRCDNEMRPIPINAHSSTGVSGVSNFREILLGRYKIEP